MKGPFPDVNLLCLSGREGKRSLCRCCSQQPGSDLGWASPAHLTLCQSSCQRSIVSESPRQYQWQISWVGCSHSLAVASRPGMLIGHSTDHYGIAAEEENVWGAREPPALAEDLNRQITGNNTRGGGHTRSATACGFLRSSKVLNRAAPGHLCVQTGLCDMPPLPRNTRAIFAVCSWFTLHGGV